MKTTKNIGLILLILSLQSCKLFTDTVAPGLVLGDWQGNWTNTDPNQSVYHKLTFQLKKNNDGVNNLFMTYTFDDGRVSDEYEAQIEQLDRSDAQNVGFKNTKVLFLEEANFGEIKYIKYSSRIREADKRLFMEVSYLKEDFSLYDPIYWKTKNYEYILD